MRIRASHGTPHILPSAAKCSTKEVARQAEGDFTQLQPFIALSFMPEGMILNALKAAAGLKEVALLGQSSGSRGNLALDLIAGGSDGAKVSDT